MVLVVLGAAIRIWAAGYIKKSEEIAFSGPFGMMRNPLYAGSFLVTLGYCIMSNRPLLSLIVMTAYCVLHAMAIMDEERYLTSVFGDQFRAYCKSVPRVFPRLPAHASSDKFSLRLVVENGEHVSVIWTAAIAAVFAMRLVL
jgi:protein-S-isoprenylcysteine O-methyltransferase Ste14